MADKMVRLRIIEFVTLYGNRQPKWYRAFRSIQCSKTEGVV